MASPAPKNAAVAAPKRAPAPKITVAQYLAHQLMLSERSQKSVAEELGYPNQNILSAMKAGITKVPINKVPAFAQALGVDKKHFLRLVMTEYMPEAWAVIQSILAPNGEDVSEADLALLKVVHSAADGHLPDLDPEAIRAIKDVIAAQVQRQTEANAALYERFQKLPRPTRARK